MKIRSLTGRKAEEYSKQLEARHEHVTFGPLSYYALQLRRFIFRLFSNKPNYFIDRHAYSPSDRRLLDLLYVANYEGHLEEGKTKYGWLARLRHTRLARAYAPEMDYENEWIRVSSYNDPIEFVWHEDIEAWRSIARDNSLQ